jgi:segregation and condensation protein B
VRERTQNGNKMENEVVNQDADPTRKAALRASIEAIVYVAEEPVTLEQIVTVLRTGSGDAAAESLRQEVIETLLSLQEDYRREDRGLEIREIAGGYKMFTKAEHHETIRRFVKNLTPPLKLSMAALETLATIAYRQPVTVPEIQQIRGVDATSVLKTLLDRKLITTAGRKNVIGRPILYRTTREFLIKFGLGSLADLPTLEEFGELARAALGEPPSGETDEFVAESSSASLDESSSTSGPDAPPFDGEPDGS